MIQLIVPLLLLSSLFDWFNCSEIFIIPENNRLSSEKFANYRHYFAITSDGKTAVYIHPTARSVKCFDLTSGTIYEKSSHTNSASYSWGPTRRSADTVFLTEADDAVAGTGRKVGQVNTPMAVTCDHRGKLLVSDLGNRRVLVFDSTLDFERSFLVPASVTVPSYVVLDESDNYITANLLLDTLASINSGFHCCVFDSAATLIDRLAPSPPVVFERNLWLGVNALIDNDKYDNIYVCFSVDPTVCVYDHDFNLTSRLYLNPTWWTTPAALPRTTFQVNTEPTEFYESWTRIIKLIHIGDGRLLLAAETNGHVADCPSRFIMDIVTAEGKTLVSAIETDYLPVGCDRNGFIYFLSLDGKELLKTEFKEMVK